MIIDQMVADELYVLDSLFSNNGLEIFTRRPDLLRQLQDYAGEEFNEFLRNPRIRLLIATAKISVKECVRKGEVLADACVAFPEDYYEILEIADAGTFNHKNVSRATAFVQRRLPRFVAYYPGENIFKALNYPLCVDQVHFTFLHVLILEIICAWKQKNLKYCCI